LRLHWIHERSEPLQIAEAELVDALASPPADEVEVLHRLAMMGNMRDVRERAAYLVRLDERYRPFAEKLRRLAVGISIQADPALGRAMHDSQIVSVYPEEQLARSKAL